MYNQYTVCTSIYIYLKHIPSLLVQPIYVYTVYIFEPNTKPSLQGKINVVTLQFIPVLQCLYGNGPFGFEGNVNFTL